MLDFTLGTVLFQLLAFIVLMLLVAKLALRPMLDVMRKRQDHIENEISSAEKARKEAEAAIEEQRKALEAAREEAHDIIERAKKQSEVEGQNIIKAAQERAERTVEQALEEIQSEKDKAVATLRDEVASLSVLLASKVLEEEIDEKKHEKEINQFMKQVGGSL